MTNPANQYFNQFTSRIWVGALIFVALNVTVLVLAHVIIEYGINKKLNKENQL